MEFKASSKRKPGAEFAIIILLLVAVLSLLLHGVFLPGHTLFSNDGPLGRLVSQCRQLPGRFAGCWEDLNGVGFNDGAAPPGISFGLQFLLKPILFSKFYALVALIILGMGAWCFFVNLRFAPVACVLGGLAAVLNSTFFSVACWGVAAQDITAGMNFFALAALADTSSRRRWLRVILAGLAVGMGVVEGADVGALFSIYVAAFVFYQAWMGEGSQTKRLMTGLSRVTLVALFAALIAAQAILTLINTNIKGVVGTQQNTQTKEMRWGWATQWSLPMPEAVGWIVPGLFGYRMDTPDGGCYWGRIGRSPAMEKYIENGEQGPPPHGFMRYSGGGFYAGVSVVLLALWAIIQSLSRKDSIFSLSQRRWLWFWSVAAILSVLLSFGHFAPFYQLIYALPYFSTIRNPVKFINLASFILIVIFAYGVDGLWRKYMTTSGSVAKSHRVGLKVWWINAGKFEKFWIYGCGLALGLSLLGWLIYASDRQALINYLETVNFDDSEAQQIASFSIRQVGWFMLFFVLSAAFMACVFSGAFAGARTRWAGIILGLLMVVDLGRADLPWIIYWNYPEKYASNPVLDRLRITPYEHRVTILPGPMSEDFSMLNDLYRQIWLQQQFPYYNIQSLDIVDMSRVPKDFMACLDAMNGINNGMGFQPFIRYWKLTNSRYELGSADALQLLNKDINQPDQQFRIIERFDIVPKPGITRPDSLEQLTAVTNENGTYALFDFPGALPRAKLYSQWQVNTNNQAILKQVGSPDFDPDRSVLVANQLPAAPTAANSKQNAGTVDLTSYKPKDIVLKSDAASPTVLLLNDHFDPNWKVLVDGKREPLLRCNYIMCGVYLPPGAHTVEFRFRLPLGLFYVSLSAILLGLLILPAVVISDRDSLKKS
jgi:hypothetical protein